MSSTSPAAKQVQDAYELAKGRYAALGVDTGEALAKLRHVTLSLHCWQGDDVAGFESPDAVLGGGLAATGNYPGKARSAGELRQDLDMVYSLLPGWHRLNLHSSYAETGGEKVERNRLEPQHFAGWVDWARGGAGGKNRHGIDFNPTLFSHPLAESGFTLSSYDPAIRQLLRREEVAWRATLAVFRPITSTGHAHHHH